MDPKLLECCNGCRACELACSFHHLNFFQPSRSSIEVIQIDHGRYRIKIHSSITDEKRLTCDKCFTEDEINCVKYCNVNVRGSLFDLLKSAWKQNRDLSIDGRM